jgi:hypothetical protein
LIHDVHKGRIAIEAGPESQNIHETTYDVGGFIASPAGRGSTHYDVPTVVQQTDRHLQDRKKRHEHRGTTVVAERSDAAGDVCRNQETRRLSLR